MVNNFGNIYVGGERTDDYKKCEINDVVDDTEGDLDFKESGSRAQKKVIHTNCDINETSDSTKSGWLYFL